MGATPLPGSLRVLAWLLIVQGVLSAAEVFVSATHGELSLNFNVIAIPAGVGLLRLSAGWRKFTVVYLWILLLLLGVVLGVLILGGAELHMNRNWQFVTGGSRAAATGALAGLLALTAWGLRVLSRPDVRALFAPAVATGTG